MPSSYPTRPLRLSYTGLRPHNIQLNLNVVNFTNLGIYNTGVINVSESHRTESNTAESHNHDGHNIDNGHISTHTNNSQHVENICPNSQPRASEAFLADHYQEIPQDQPSVYDSYPDEDSRRPPAPIATHPADRSTQDPADTFWSGFPAQPRRTSYTSQDQAGRPSSRRPSSPMLGSDMLADEALPFHIAAGHYDDDPRRSDRDPGPRFWSTTANKGSCSSFFDPEDAVLEPEPEPAPQPELESWGTVTTTTTTPIEGEASALMSLADTHLQSTPADLDRAVMTSSSEDSNSPFSLPMTRNEPEQHDYTAPAVLSFHPSQMLVDSTQPYRSITDSYSDSDIYGDGDGYGYGYGYSDSDGYDDGYSDIYSYQYGNAIDLVVIANTNILLLPLPLLLLLLLIFILILLILATAVLPSLLHA